MIPILRFHRCFLSECVSNCSARTHDNIYIIYGKICGNERKILVLITTDYLSNSFHHLIVHEDFPFEVESRTKRSAASHILWCGFKNQERSSRIIFIEVDTVDDACEIIGSSFWCRFWADFVMFQLQIIFNEVTEHWLN